MKDSKAMRWPYGIALSFILIIGLIYATIVVSLEYPVEQSDINLQNYHAYDKNVNDFIQKQIAFDKLYTLSYEGEPVNAEATVLRYKITDKAGKPVNNAQIKVMVTRPDTHKFDMPLEKFSVAEGIYTSETITLPKAGRWNLIANIIVDGHERYLNLKADTRYPNVFEY